MSSSTLSSSSSKALLKKAREELEAGDPDAALALCKKVLGADKTNYNAYILVGFCAARKQEPSRALQAYDRAISLKPENPLAWKGIVDSLRDIPPVDAGGDRALLLRRARAQVKLTELRPASDLANGNLAAIEDASSLLFELAQDDLTLAEEAISACRMLPDNATPPRKAGDVSALIALLSYAVLKQKHGDTLGGDFDSAEWETGDLGKALNSVQAAVTSRGSMAVDIEAFQLVVRRVLWRVKADKITLSDASKQLQEMAAFEELLGLLEEDRVFERATVSYKFRIFVAQKGVHSTAWQGAGPRASAVLASWLWVDGKGLSPAIDFLTSCLPMSSAKHGDSSRLKKQSPLVAGVVSPSQSLVRACFHFSSHEYKQCVTAASHGVLLCEQMGYRTRMCALLRILGGEALLKEDCPNGAATEFDRALELLKENAISVPGYDRLEYLCHRGIVRARIAVNGRESLGAATAINAAAVSACEETAAFGQLEAIWSSVIEGSTGDYSAQIVALEALVDRSVDSGGAIKECSLVPWDFTLVAKSVVVCNDEISAVASMRLARLLCARDKSPSTLKQAKQLLMKSASLFGSSPDPYALLGLVFEWESALCENELDVNGIGKILGRSVRCFRKCVNLDQSHPVGARCLVRYLLSASKTARRASQGDDEEEAVYVARRVTEKKPRARWAWNVLGWAHLRKGLFSEASFAFQGALRGQSEVSHSAAEVFFGTGVGTDAKSFIEGDLAVDVDSWHGLALAYKQQKKYAPACSCLDSAISLAASFQNGTGDSMLQSCRSVLRNERANILTLLGKPKEALDGLVSSCDFSPANIGFLSEQDAKRIVWTETPSRTTAMRYACLGGSHLERGNTAWEQGWFQRAFRSRCIAVSYFVCALVQTKTVEPLLSPASSYKRIGDTIRAAATDEPLFMKSIIPREDLGHLLSTAATAYQHSLHYEPWRSSAGGAHDLGTVLASCASATEYSDEALLQLSLRSLTSEKVPSRGSIGRLLGELGRQGANSSDLRTAEVSLLVIEAEHGHDVERQLSASMRLAGLYAERQDNEEASRWAFAALRLDATDWKAWYAAGLAREVDAERRGWPEDAVRSTMAAFSEADKLGGGGPMVARRVASSSARLALALRENRESADVVAREAAASVADSVRAGIASSSACRQTIRTACAELEESTSMKIRQEDFDTAQKLHLCHLFPHMGAAVHLLSTYR